MLQTHKSPGPGWRCHHLKQHLTWISPPQTPCNGCSQSSPRQPPATYACSAVNFIRGFLSMDLRTVSMTRSQDGPLVRVAREGEIFNRVLTTGGSQPPYFLD